MSMCMRKQTIWVPTRFDTNRPVQSQKQARNLKFWILEEERLYYPCSENKGADQLCSYCTADLRLCFHLCRLLVFPCSGSMSLCFIWFTFAIMKSFGGMILHNCYIYNFGFLL